MECNPMTRLQSVKQQLPRPATSYLSLSPLPDSLFLSPKFVIPCGSLSLSFSSLSLFCSLSSSLLRVSRPPRRFVFGHISQSQTGGCGTYPQLAAALSNQKTSSRQGSGSHPPPPPPPPCSLACSLTVTLPGLQKEREREESKCGSSVLYSLSLDCTARIFLHLLGGWEKLNVVKRGTPGCFFLSFFFLFFLPLEFCPLECWCVCVCVCVCVRDILSVRG